MHYELLVFDLEGTLADPLPATIGILNFLAEGRGLTGLRRHDAARLADRSAAGLARQLPLCAWRRRQVARRIESLLPREVDAIGLRDGIEATLGDLARRGRRIAVVSRWPGAAARSLLGDRLVAAIDHLEPGRPLVSGRRRLARVLDAFDVRPCRALHVSDRCEDAGLARSLGMSVGAAAWGRTAIDRLRSLSPEEIFHAPDELLRLSDPCARGSRSARTASGRIAHRA